MRMVRWMCRVKLKDRLPSKELRERLGIDDIALVLPGPSASEVTTLWRYTNLLIIIIIIIAAKQAALVWACAAKR